jgi:L-ascorbate metabolism protein UlaG (beta-lactamase superfamily)
MSTKKFTENSELLTFAPLNWQGTPLDESGRFVNLNHPFKPEFSQLLKWQTQKNPQRIEKKNDDWLPDIQADGDFFSRKDDCFVWLGHSSFFIRLDGKGFLIDPVFGDATVVKRKVPFPYSAEIEKEVDYLLLSHDHRDHFDGPSLKEFSKLNPAFNVLTGLNMSSITEQYFSKNKIQEAGWYQKFKTTEDIEIWFLPSRHWSRRSISDTNKRLWGSFLISSSKHTFYFMGDSGYDNHFLEIAKIFPKVNFAIMGIGAYSPQWFMHSSHMTPEDSWKSFKDLGAEMFIPMHYGTFDLADEPFGEPLMRIKSTAEPGKLIAPFIGQTIWI